MAENIVGERIKELREAMGWTQQQFAEIVNIRGVKAPTISKQEHGKLGVYDHQVKRYAEVFDVDAEYLWGADYKHKIVGEIAAEIPLNERSIESLRWLKKACDDGTMEEHAITAGVIDTLINALIGEGIVDDMNGEVWDIGKLINMIVVANREDEANPKINHTLFLRQAFCMALGGIAFDYINNIVKETMTERRVDLEENEKFLSSIEN